MRVRSLRLIAVLTAALSLLLVPAVAHAYAPTGDDFISCVAGGDNNVECVAGVFDEGCVADITVTDEDGEVIDTATGTADEDGEVEFDFDVPEGQEDGDITVTIECGDKVLADVIANVDDGEVIANTGFNSTTLAGIAVAALGLGAGALAVTRRRGASES